MSGLHSIKTLLILPVPHFASNGKYIHINFYFTNTDVNISGVT